MTIEVHDEHGAAHGRYELRQVSPDDWVIVDTLIGDSPADETQRLVACVSEHDGFVEVRWFRHVNLAPRFPDRAQALMALNAAEEEAQLALL